MAQHKYDGFISYSRLDTAVALRLRKRLESTKAPAGVTRVSLRMFLDSDELAASAGPSSSIRQALGASNFLVVIASPHSAASESVLGEVRTWVELNGWNRVLVVLAAGEQSLLRAFSNPEDGDDYDAPLAADVRAPNLRATLRLLDDESLRIAARIMGIEFDALRQRAVRERLARQRRLIAFLSGAIVLITGAVVSAIWQWRVADAERQTAERRLKQAIAVAETVISKVDGELKDVHGAEQLRGAMLAEASSRLDRLALDHSRDTRLSQAQLLGHLRRATLAGQALDIVATERELSEAEHLLQQIPANLRPQAETLASRVRCELAFSRQLYAEALSCLDRAEQAGRGWAASGALESRLQLAQILRLRGDAKAHARNWKAASADYYEAESLIEQIRRAGPDTAELILAAAVVEQCLSRVEEVARNESGVLDRLVKSTNLLERVLQRELSTPGLVQLIEVYQRLAGSCSRWKREGLAKSLNTKAYDLAYALYVSSPQNTRYQLALAAAEHARGKDALREERFMRATLFFAQEGELLKVHLNKDPTNTQAWRDYFGAKAMLIETLVAQKCLPEGLEEFARLDSAVRDFVAARAGSVSDEALAVGIRGFNLVADAARQVDRPKARVEASEKSFQLAMQRSAASPDLGDAQMDLFIAHANMILAAAVTNETEAMEAHAREARRLMPAENSIEPDERELITGIQKLIAQVIRPISHAQSAH